MLFVMPGVIAVSNGSSTTPDITVKDFPPRVWMCDSRVVYDDNTEPGRIFPVCLDAADRLVDIYTNEAACEADGICIAPSFITEATCTAATGVWVNGICTAPSFITEATCTAATGVWVLNTWTSNELVERINNYAFEGEQIHWTVLVMDKNKIDQNIDVYATIGTNQGEGNQIEVNCQRIGCIRNLMESCNARIDEEVIDECDPDLMDMFDCTFTVETPEKMNGEYWITVEADDGGVEKGVMDENEFWFLNPAVAVVVDDPMTFGEVIPGTDAYSTTMRVGNGAEDDSGVMMDMFISGTDFYDSSSSGARCPTTNQLTLDHFRYFATSGAYNSAQDLDIDLVDGDRNTDVEGYTNIDYGIGFNNPDPFYDNMEILQAQKVGPYYTANILAPGAEMAITFKLSLPEPCNGNFDSGSIYFWGEAI